MDAAWALHGHHSARAAQSPESQSVRSMPSPRRAQLVNPSTHSCHKTQSQHAYAQPLAGQSRGPISESMTHASTDSYLYMEGLILPPASYTNAEEVAQCHRYSASDGCEGHYSATLATRDGCRMDAMQLTLGAHYRSISLHCTLRAFSLCLTGVDRMTVSGEVSGDVSACCRANTLDAAEVDYRTH